MRELNELALIGAGIGGVFANTEESHVKKHEQAKSDDVENWQTAVQEEWIHVRDNKVFKPNEQWNGDPEFLFTASGKADSDFAKRSGDKTQR
jgi:hypothetical protein